jgi:hypothetical protein
MVLILLFLLILSLQSCQREVSIGPKWTNWKAKTRSFVELQNGKRYIGQIAKIRHNEATTQTVQLNTEAGTLTVAQSDVISVQQSEGNFWSQLNGSIDYGLSNASGNSTLSSSLGADVNYQRTKDYVELATSSQFSRQSNGPSTNRFTFDASIFASCPGNGSTGICWNS